MEAPASPKKDDSPHSPIGVPSTSSTCLTLRCGSTERRGSWEACRFHSALPQELRSGIHSSSGMKRQLKGGGKINGEKINVKAVKAIPISSLIDGLLKSQRAFLSATFYFYSNRPTANGKEAIMQNQKD